MEAAIKRDQLEKIRHFLALEYYDSVVKESCSLLEEILKKIYRKALAEFSIEDRGALMQSEAMIGNNKGYDKFGFGELVGLFNKSRLLERWAKNTNQNLGIIRSISLEYIVDMRNQLTHQPTKTNVCDKNAANLVYNCLTNWLSFIGYSEMDSGINKAIANKDEDTLEKVDFHKQYLNAKTLSSYSSSTLNEQRRLQVQFQYSEKSDHEAFMHAFKHIHQSDNLIGLDVGCADGSLTVKRFKQEYGFKHVIGIDVNATSIERAKLRRDVDFSFYHVDAEGNDFDDIVDDIKDSLGVDGFDVVYMGFTLHHFREPTRFLRKIRRHMKPGGAIILTGVDDGGQLAYGDDNLVEEIVEKSIKTNKMSDRFHGRKFYPYLVNAGFLDVSIHYGIQDTSRMMPEDRDYLFQYYFSFRKDYTKRQLEEDPSNEGYQKHHQEMVNAINELEDKFQQPSFYYMVLTITAVGFKAK